MKRPRLIYLVHSLQLAKYFCFESLCHILIGDSNVLIRLQEFPIHVKGAD